MSATATVTAIPQQTAPPKWESIGNYIVLMAYSAVVLFTVRYHEKWADEAQAWLIARDLDLKTLWFHGTPLRRSPWPVAHNPVGGTACISRALWSYLVI